MNIINKYFPEFTAEQNLKLAKLPEIYAEVNQRVNVVSRKDIQNLLERHILHSLAIAKFLNFQVGCSVIDVGTGGGFPGIPLAIAFPKAEFFLVDSIGKKVKVVEEVVQELGLKNVRAKQTRAENVDEVFDFVVSRAVAKIETLYAWSRPLIGSYHNHSIKNGLVCLKGGDLSEEFAGFKKKHQFIDLQDFFQEEFFESKKLVYVPR